jgi:hypothetical protein
VSAMVSILRVGDDIEKVRATRNGYVCLLRGSYMRKLTWFEVSASANPIVVSGSNECTGTLGTKGP